MEQEMVSITRIQKVIHTALFNFYSYLTNYSRVDYLVNLLIFYSFILVGCVLIHVHLYENLRSRMTSLLHSILGRSFLYQQE
jgi:hypothetical protein